MGALGHEIETMPALASGTVVKLDRGFPLVELDAPAHEQPDRIRCEHATDIKKRGSLRAAIGDRVRLELPEGHDMGIIRDILPRQTELVRKDPTERSLPQTIAANFQLVCIMQPVDSLNIRRLERELVIAHQTGAKVAILLTKADKLDEEAQRRIVQEVSNSAGKDVEVLCVSRERPESVEAVRKMVPEGCTAVMVGKSGVGKSTLANALLGEQRRKTSSVREADGKGRHTTVSREMMRIPGGGTIVDMPGLRGLGLWDAEGGIARAFADVEGISEGCRFRDCTHTSEPGCAVLSAIKEGELPKERLDSYHLLRDELIQTETRKRQSNWKNK